MRLIRFYILELYPVKSTANFLFSYIESHIQLINSARYR